MTQVVLSCGYVQEILHVSAVLEIALELLNISLDIL